MGTAKISAENSGMYDTTKEEPPKTGPTDYTDEEFEGNEDELDF